MPIISKFPQNFSALAEIIVTVESGSTVTCTNEGTTLTGVSDGTVTFKLPVIGTWTVTATKDGKTSSTSVVVTETIRYNVTIEYFTATYHLNTMVGAVVTLTGNDYSETKTCTAETFGTVDFTVNRSGGYTAVAYYNGIPSETVVLPALEDGGSLSANINFITLSINIDDGSTIIVSKGDYVYTKVTEYGYAEFLLPELGEWNVNASLGSKTMSTTIPVLEYATTWIELEYYSVFGVDIDLTNSNPETAVTYTDDAVGMSGGDSMWDFKAIFKDIKPCLLKNGVVQYYLSSWDYNYKSEWGESDITSGADGDVMIEIPKTGYKITTVGDVCSVRITNNPNAGSDGYKYYAHTRVTEGDRDKLYIGAYLGYTSDSKLHSLSGVTPTGNQNFTTFRTQAQANGEGYDLLSFYPLTLLQCLYLIRYKSLNSQVALGAGYTNASSVGVTGATNSSGMYYGTTSATDHVKFAGIEDVYGNCNIFVDGIYSSSGRNILTAFDGFNDTGSEYINQGRGSTTNVSGYMSKPQGTSEMGFVIKSSGGSATTYFADDSRLYSSRLLTYGGNFGSGGSAGIFRTYIGSTTSTTDSAYCGRLMYL